MSDVSESEISSSDSSVYFEDSANKSKPQTSKSKPARKTSTKKKSASSSASSSKAKPNSKRKKAEEAQKYKSAAMIEDSDEEDYALDGNGFVLTKATSKTTSKPDSEVDEKDVDSDDEGTRQPAQKKRKVEKLASKPISSSMDTVKKKIDSKRESKKSSAKKPVKEDDGDSSSAEAAVQKSSSKTKKSADPPARKGKKAELSKDEETIKQLKSFVVACGQRKVWSKEFKDIADDPSAQIRRLKQLLADLGMTGRMSLAKAKEIKAKRDMAQELEDVQSFHQSVVAPPAGKRATRGQTTKAPVAVESSDESEAEGSDVQPKRKAKNAHQSIMAFLGDQSDDD